MSNRVTAESNGVKFLETVWEKRRSKLLKLLDLQETRYNIFSVDSTEIDGLNENNDVYKVSNETKVNVKSNGEENTCK